MTTFQYWIPDGGVTVTRDELTRHGLAYALDGSVTARLCGSGPDGRHGCVVVAGDNADGRCGYWPGKQTWRKLPDSNAWVGMHDALPPDPEELAREDQVSGLWITADDDSQWLVPMARRWQEFDGQLMWDYNLPRRLTLNDDGLWIQGDVKPRYTRLWELVLGYENAMQNAFAELPDDHDGPVQFSYPEINDLAVGALQINYRIGPVELDLLGIYDDQLRQRIIDVVLDTATWTKWIQKKTREVARDGGTS